MRGSACLSQHVSSWDNAQSHRARCIESGRHAGGCCRSGREQLDGCFSSKSGRGPIFSSGPGADRFVRTQRDPKSLTASLNIRRRRTHHWTEPLTKDLFVSSSPDKVTCAFIQVLSLKERYSMRFAHVLISFVVAVGAVAPASAEPLWGKGFLGIPKKLPQTPWSQVQTSPVHGPCGGTCRDGNGRQWNCRSNEAPVFYDGGVCRCEVEQRCR